MKLLITGGAGFIGSAVIRHIINNTTDEVVNLDKLTYAGNLESLTEVSGSARYSFEQVDICNRAEVDRVLAQHQPDAIMHLAAESHGDRSKNGSAAFVETNMTGTYTLLEVTRSHWQELAEPSKARFRFHYISTNEVYGDLGRPEILYTEHHALALYKVVKVGETYNIGGHNEKRNIEVVHTLCNILQELAPPSNSAPFVGATSVANWRRLHVKAADPSTTDRVDRQ